PGERSLQRRSEDRPIGDSSLIQQGLEHSPGTLSQVREVERLVDLERRAGELAGDVPSYGVTAHRGLEPGMERCAFNDEQRFTARESIVDHGVARLHPGEVLL